MASPFRLFRKHVKPLLVVFTVLLIIAWLGGGGLNSYTNSSGGAKRAAQRASDVAVRWDGGSLNNQQVDELTRRRKILNDFLKQVQGQGEMQAYRAGVEPRALRVQQMLGPEKPQDGLEQNVVQVKLFADAARAAGMRVSDDAIVAYLDELGRGNVSREEMRAILKSYQKNGGNVSIEYVLDVLREEMLARNYLASFQWANVTVTPDQRWKDWLRVNDRVIVEAAAVPIDQFMVDVKDPTDAELTEYFDKYKSVDPHPDFIGEMEFPSASPGFRIPRKIDLQFAQADYNEILKKAESQVTEEQIVKFYDERKDPLFIKTELIDDAAKKDEAGAAKAPETPAEGTTPEASPKSDEEKSETPTQPAPGGEAAPKGEGTEPAPEGKESSRDTRHASPFRLAAFQDKGESAEPAGEASQSPPAEQPAAPEQPADAKAGEAPTDPAASAPADGTPPPASTPPATESPAATPPAAGAPASTELPAVVPPAEKKPPEFQPLDDKLREQIRRMIAEGTVPDEVKKVAGELEGELKGEYEHYFGEILDAKGQKAEPPAPPASLTDFSALAAKYGLKYGKTGPLSLLELRNMPIGKSGIPDTGVPLWYELFQGHDMDLYEPKSTVDVDNNNYVSMKLSDSPARVPQLAEVRDEVIKAWKRQKAGELALKHTEELAKKAQDSKSPLTNFFADDKTVKVIRTDPFSELTGGIGFVGGQLQPQPFRLSEPDGVVAAGPLLLRKVFELKDGEVGAVLNHDHTIAYVLRVVEHQPSRDELRTAYLGEANMWPGRQVMTAAHAQDMRGVVARDILTGKGLKWERQADKVEEEGDDEEGDAG